MSLPRLLSKSASDIVIVSALRTPITRAHKGGFRNTYPEELLSHILRSIRPAYPISDVTMGTVLAELGGAKSGRMALLHAGYPVSTTFSTVNRQCSSGLQAIANAVMALQAGMVDTAIAGGVESMTRNYGSRAIPVDLSPALRESPVKDARDCILPMGVTSENVARRYAISREDQDRFALSSHQKAGKAQKEGSFDAEIVAMRTRVVGEDGVETEVLVDRDDGIRHNASLEGLAKLKPAFMEGGTGTAGNSSQISDGAAAAVMMRRDKAERLGVRPIAKYVATAVAGVAPDEMGIGPALAIPGVLEMAGIGVGDVGIWELNEAFASQALYCIRTLGLPEERVNPKGGAIALGHPLGATGARQMATLLPELERRGEKIGVVSMCIGTGSGLATVVVRE